jgi:hypothetical protein
MARPPPGENVKPPRPGVMGFIQDRIDYIKLAFVNYLKDQDSRRAAIAKVAKDKFGKDVKYETKSKGKADKKASEAGAVEKLK